MSPGPPVPSDPPTFHITHVDNLPGILREGGLWCDAQRLARQLTNTNIGYRHIKNRRLARAVSTTGGTLGDYVPFNFCPRSVMLYVVSRGHSDYTGGQEDVVHLVSSVRTTGALGLSCTFTDRHADLAHALFYTDLRDLSQIDWNVMRQKRWEEKKEERQAEFLVKEFFPWKGITGIAVMTPAAAARAQAAIHDAPHQPPIAVKPEWYYSE